MPTLRTSSPIPAPRTTSQRRRMASLSAAVIAGALLLTSCSQVRAEPLTETAGDGKAVTAQRADSSVPQTTGRDSERPFVNRTPNGPGDGPDAQIEAPALPDRRPNVVLITTDDQADTDLAFMPLTLELLVEEGVHATNFINPHPVCCPARAEILSGEYAQNNGVQHNSGPWGGWGAYAGHERNLTGNVGSWLHSSGYSTAFVGKMLNGYGATIGKSGRQIQGWDHWNPTTRGTYNFYDTEFYNDGNPVDHDEYVADVVTDYARGYIDEFTSGENADRPFFIWASHVGPHGATVAKKTWVPPIPARRHEDMFTSEKPRSFGKPSFNESDVSDKASYTAKQKPTTKKRARFVHQRRLQSLQAIDESNAALIQALADAGELENTIVMFTSDNGFFLGEHRFLKKNYPYEENLQIPFAVRGPGLPAGTRTAEQLTMVDLTPTILARAGVLGAVRASGRTDGIDMWPVLRGEEKVNSTQLIQAGQTKKKVLKAGGWLFRGVHTGRYTYAWWYNGDEELFDNKLDPYQLDSKHDDRAYRPVLREMRKRYRMLEDCRGVQECEHQKFGPQPKPKKAALQRARGDQQRPAARRASLRGDWHYEHRVY